MCLPISLKIKKYEKCTDIFLKKYPKIIIHNRIFQKIKNIEKTAPFFKKTKILKNKPSNILRN